MVVIASILMVMVVYFLIMGYTQRDFLKSFDKKEHSLSFLYPGIWHILSRLPEGKKEEGRDKRREQLKALAAGEAAEKAFRDFRLKRSAAAIAVFMLFLMLSIGAMGRNEASRELTDGRFIPRPAYGEEAREVPVMVRMEDAEGVTEENTILRVEEREYTWEEWKEAVEKAEDYIDKAVLGENHSVDSVKKPLRLIKEIPDTPIKIKWETGEEGIIEENGRLAEGKDGLTSLKAILIHKDWQTEYEFFVRVLPRVPSLKDVHSEKLKKALKKAQEASKTKESLVLPAKAENTKLTFQEERDAGSMFPVLGILAAVAAGLAQGEALDKRMKRRELQLRMDYPEIINKFTLLLGAGMTLAKAWERMVEEYAGKKKKEQKLFRYAYEEMTVTWHEIRNGISERAAFESFGKRVKLLPYLKWSALLSQNVKKGTKGLLELLELEAVDAFQERKELAKRLGEEAGTKLLAPMALMLLVVIAIVMVPALMSFSS